MALIGPVGADLVSARKFSSGQAQGLPPQFPLFTEQALTLKVASFARFGLTFVNRSAVRLWAFAAMAIITGGALLQVEIPEAPNTPDSLAKIFEALRGGFDGSDQTEWTRSLISWRVRFEALGPGDSLREGRVLRVIRQIEAWLGGHVNPRQRPIVSYLLERIHDSLSGLPLMEECRIQAWAIADHGADWSVYQIRAAISCLRKDFELLAGRGEAPEETLSQIIELQQLALDPVFDSEQFQSGMVEFAEQLGSPAGALRGGVRSFRNTGTPTLPAQAAPAQPPAPRNDPAWYEPLRKLAERVGSELENAGYAVKDLAPMIDVQANTLDAFFGGYGSASQALGETERKRLEVLLREIDAMSPTRLSRCAAWGYPLDSILASGRPGEAPPTDLTDALDRIRQLTGSAPNAGIKSMVDADVIAVTSVSKRLGWVLEHRRHDASLHMKGAEPKPANVRPPAVVVPAPARPAALPAPRINAPALPVPPPPPAVRAPAIPLTPPVRPKPVPRPFAEDSRPVRTVADYPVHSFVKGPDGVGQIVGKQGGALLVDLVDGTVRVSYFPDFETITVVPNPKKHGPGAPTGMAAPTAWVVDQTAGRLWRLWRGEDLPDWLSVIVGGVYETVGILWGLPHLAALVGLGQQAAPVLANPWFQGTLFMVLHLMGRLRAWESAGDGMFNLVPLDFSQGPWFKKVFWFVLAYGWIFGLGVLFQWYSPQELHWSFLGMSPTTTAVWAHALAYNVLLTPVLSFVGITLPVAMATDDRGPGTDASDEASVDETITRAEARLQKSQEAEALNLLAPILNNQRAEEFSTTGAKIAAYQRIARVVEAVQQKSSGILPAKAQMLHQLALALAILGEYEPSVHLFEQAFATLESLKPQDPPLYLEISAAAYLAKGRAELHEWDFREGTFTHLVEAAESLTKSLAYQRARVKTDVGEQQISYVLSLLGWISYHALWTEDQENPAPLLKRAGDFVEEALKRNPSAVYALTLKGTLLLKAGQAREAISFFEEALKSGDWSVAQIGLLSALLREKAWSAVSDQFKNVPYFETLDVYAKGLELARRGDSHWKTERSQAIALYKEALSMWDHALELRVVDLIGIREDYARAVEDLFRIEVRSGKVTQGIDTVIGMLRNGMVKFNSMAALIAEELPDESYPELAASLRSFDADKKDRAARLARLIDKNLKDRRDLPENDPSRTAMRELVQELDPQGKGEEADLKESHRRVKDLDEALKPVEVSVPVPAGLSGIFTRNPESAGQALTDEVIDLAPFVLPGKSDTRQPQIGASASIPKKSVPDLESDLEDLNLLIRKKLEKISPAPNEQLIFKQLNNLFERLAGHDYDEVYQLAREERGEPGPFLKFSQILADAKALNAFFDHCNTIALTYQKLHDRRGPERSRGDELPRARAYLAVAQRLTDGRPSAVPVMDRLTLCTNLGQIENELDHPDQAFVQTDRALKLSRLIRQALTGPHAVPRDDISPRDGERLRSTAQDTEKKVAGQEGLALSIRGSGHQLKLEWAKAADVFLEVRHDPQRFENLSASEQQNIRFHLAYSLYIHHRTDPIDKADVSWEIEAQTALEELFKSGLAAEFGLVLYSLSHLLLIREAVRRKELEEAHDAAMKILDKLLKEAGIEFSGPHNPLVLLIQPANKPAVEAVFSRYPGLQDLIAEDVLVWLKRCAEQLEWTPEAKRAAEAINLFKETAVPGEELLLGSQAADEGDATVAKARADVKRDPNSMDYQWAFARALDKEGSIHAEAGRDRQAIALCEEALKAYRRFGELSEPHLPLKPEDTQLLARLWQGDSPESLINEVSRSSARFSAMAIPLRRKRGIEAIFEYIHHMAGLQIDLGRLYDKTQDKPASQRAHQCSLALLIAADFLSRDQPLIPVSQRVRILEKAGEAAMRLNRREIMLDYFARGAKMAADAHRVLETDPRGGESDTTETSFAARAVRMYFRGGIQHYLYEQWDLARQAMMRVLELGAAGLDESNHLVAETILGGATYGLALAREGSVDSAGLEQVIVHMDRVLERASDPKLRRDAHVFRGLASARLAMLRPDPDPAAALNAASANLVSAFRREKETTLTLDQVLDQISERAQEFHSDEGRLAELLRLVGDLAGRCGKPDLKIHAEALAQMLMADEVVDGQTSAHVDALPAPDQDPELAKVLNLWDHKKSDEAKAALIDVFDTWDQTTPPGWTGQAIDLIGPMFPPEERARMYERVIVINDQYVQENPTWCGFYITNVRACIFMANLKRCANDLAGAVTAVQRGARYRDKFNVIVQQYGLDVGNSGRQFERRTQASLDDLWGLLLIDQWKRLPGSRTPQLLNQALDHFSSALQTIGQLPEDDLINVPQSRSEVNRGLAMARYYRSTHEQGAEEAKWLKAAEQSADAALAEDPHEPMSLWVKGQAAMRRGDYEIARERFAEAVEHNRSGYTEPFEGSIRASLALKDFDGAAAGVQRLPVNSPLRGIYEGLVAVRRAHHNGDLSLYQAALTAWEPFLSNLAGIPALIGIGEDLRSFLQDLTIAFLQSDKVSETIAAVMVVIKEEMGAQALVQPLVERLDLDGHRALAAAIEPLLAQPAVTAFATSLAQALAAQTPVSEGQTEALALLRELTSEQAKLQRSAEEKWKETNRQDAKTVGNFFANKFWEKLEPERKAKLLISWASAFLTVSKTGKEGQPQAEARRLMIARFVDEVRKAVKAGVTEEGGVVRVSIGKKVLQDVQRVFVTDMEGAPKNAYGFNIRNMPQITDVLRGLTTPLQLGLASYKAQTAEEDFAKAEKEIKALTVKTVEEVLAAPDAALAAVDAQETFLNTTLRGLIPPGRAAQALFDRLQVMTGQLGTERRRVVTAPWLGLQRRVADLKDDADDTTLAAIDKDLGDLQATLKRKDMTPEPADLPQTIATSLESARQRVIAHREAQERLRLEELQAAVLAKNRRMAVILNAAWDALAAHIGRLYSTEDETLVPGIRQRKNNLELASWGIIRFAARSAHINRLLEAAVLRIADAKRLKDLAALEKEWDALEERATKDLSLEALETDGKDLIGRSPSSTFPELAARVSGWPDLVAAARQRIQRNQETAGRNNKIVNHPITKALLPKDLASKRADKILEYIETLLAIPGRESVTLDQYFVWLTAANEAEAQERGLPVETYYAISQAVHDSLLPKTVEGGDEDELTHRKAEFDRRNAMTEHVYLAISEFYSVPDSTRLSGVTRVFTTSFEPDSKRSIRCEFASANIPWNDGPSQPIFLRLGPTKAGKVGKAESGATRVAVLLPTPPKGISQVLAVAKLPLKQTLRTAILIGLGYGESEASAIARIHQEGRKNFKEYRLPETTPDDRRLLDNYRQARPKPDDDDTEAPERTFLDMLLAECGPGGSLAALPDAITALRTQTPVGSFSADRVRHSLGDGLILSRFRFIQDRLAATPVDDSAPAAMSAAARELGALFDEFIARMAQPAGVSDDGDAAFAQLERDFLSLQDAYDALLKSRQEAESAQQEAVAEAATHAAGTTGLIGKLKEFFLEADKNEAVKKAECWIQDAYYVLSDLEKRVHPANEYDVSAEHIHTLRESFSEIRQSVGGGDRDAIRLNLCQYLGTLNHHLFYPATHRWLRLDDDDFAGLGGVHMEEPLVMRWLWLSPEHQQGFTFLLTSGDHPPSYSFHQGLALLSKEWLEKLFKSELEAKSKLDLKRAERGEVHVSPMDERAKRAFKRRLVEREVIRRIRQAVETTMIRTIVARYEGDEEGISSALQPESPHLKELQQMTEPELLEIALQFRQLIDAQDPNKIQDQLLRLRAGKNANDKALSFVWNEVFTQFNLPNKVIMDLMSKLRSLGPVEARYQFKALMNAHLRLPVEGGLLPDFVDGRYKLTGPSRELLEEIYKAMELDEPPAKTVPPSPTGRGGGAHRGHRGSGAPGRPSDRDDGGVATRPGSRSFPGRPAILGGRWRPWSETLVFRWLPWTVTSTIVFGAPFLALTLGLPFSLGLAVSLLALRPLATKMLDFSIDKFALKHLGRLNPKTQQPYTWDDVIKVAEHARDFLVTFLVGAGLPMALFTVWMVRMLQAGGERPSMLVILAAPAVTGLVGWLASTIHHARHDRRVMNPLYQGSAQPAMLGRQRRHRRLRPTAEDREFFGSRSEPASHPRAEVFVDSLDRWLKSEGKEVSRYHASDLKSEDLYWKVRALYEDLSLVFALADPYAGVNVEEFWEAVYLSILTLIREEGPSIRWGFIWTPVERTILTTLRKVYGWDFEDPSGRFAGPSLISLVNSLRHAPSYLSGSKLRDEIKNEGPDRWRNFLLALSGTFHTQPIQNEEGTPTEGLLQSMEKIVLSHQFDAVLPRVLATLAPEQAVLVMMRYGLGGYDESTLEELAQPIDPHRETIRKRMAKAMRKLRHPVRSALLEPFFSEDLGLTTSRAYDRRAA